MAYPIPQSIRSSRLNIRVMEERDLPAIFACYDNAEIRRYCPPTRWPTMEHAQRWFARIQQRMVDGDAMQFVIELAESAVPIGTCVLFKIDEGSKRAEIGYALGREFWGAGYIQEALRALIDCAFREIELHRLEAEIDPRNAASAKCLIRLGFSHEGTLRERWIDNGEITDSGVYGLLGREWIALHSNFPGSVLP